MSVNYGGFSALIDGSRARLEDATKFNDAVDRTIHNQLGNLWTTIAIPEQYQQLTNTTDLSTLQRLQGEDNFFLGQLSLPGQMAYHYYMGQAMPYLSLGNIRNQLAQQALIGQYMYNPSFLGMMGGMLPSGVR